MDRYFCEQKISGEQIELTGTEAHHLIHVMRARAGRQVVVFDGFGGEYLAEIDQVRRDAALLRLIEHRPIERELPGRLVIAAALPKGDRQKWLVEKLVELGVSAFVPLTTQRSVSEPGEAARTRLARTVVAASKQCGRNRLMEIAEAVEWTEFAVECRADIRLLAHPASAAAECFDSGSASALLPNDSGCCQTLPPLNVPSEIVAAVGPEGGFTDAEVAAAIQAQWICFDLGPRILRVETAALVMAALCVDRLQQTAETPTPQCNETRKTNR